jgi:toxin CptA
MASLRPYLCLRPSWILTGVLGVAHTGAVLCLIPLALPWAMKVLAGLLVLANLVYTVGYHGWRCTPNAPVAVILTPEGGWQVVTWRGEQWDGMLLPDSYLHPWLTVLRFRPPGRLPISVILVPDGVDPAAFRRLRVRLGGERLQASGKGLPLPDSPSRTPATEKKPGQTGGARKSG